MFLLTTSKGIEKYNKKTLKLRFPEGSYKFSEISAKIYQKFMENFKQKRGICKSQTFNCNKKNNFKNSLCSSMMNMSIIYFYYLP